MNLASKIVSLSAFTFFVNFATQAELTKRKLSASAPSNLSSYYPFLKNYYNRTGAVPDLLGYQSYKTSSGADIQSEFPGKSLPLTLTCQDNNGCYGYSMSVYKDGFTLRNRNSQPVLEMYLSTANGFSQKMIDSYLNNYNQSHVTSGVSGHFAPTQNINIDTAVGYSKPIVTLFLNVDALKNSNYILSTRTNGFQQYQLREPINNPVYNTGGVTFKLLNSVAATSCTPGGNISVGYNETKGVKTAILEQLTVQVGLSATVEADATFLGTGGKASATVQTSISAMTGSEITNEIQNSEQVTYTTDLGANNSGVVAVYQAYNTIKVKAERLETFLQTVNAALNNEVSADLGGNTRTEDGSSIGTTFPIDNGQKFANITYVSWITGPCAQ